MAQFKLLIKRGIDLPLLLILAGVLGGLFGFRVVGLFIGPMFLAVTYRLLQAWVLEEESFEASTTTQRTAMTSSEKPSRQQPLPPQEFLDQ